MLSKVNSCATLGLESVLVEVEVDVSKKGFPAFNIVGLPGKAVEEAKERIRSALKNSSFKFPDHRLTINLSPADLPKEGPAYDLPMALGILIANGQTNPDLNKSLVIGELSLDGSLRHTKGVLPLAIFASSFTIYELQQKLPVSQALALGWGAGFSWLIWWVMLKVIKRFSNSKYHPLLGVDPLTPGRRIICLLIMILFLLILVPIPLRVTM